MAAFRRGDRRHKTDVRIGCGSAYSEDRLEPAVDLAERGQLDYLALDCLAERTLVHAQLRRLADPATGYDIRLRELIQRLVPPCVENGVALIGNMGAANPQAAVEVTLALAREMGLRGLRVASIVGDNVLDLVKRTDPVLAETGRPLSELWGEVASANAYIGGEKIVEALEQDADVVLGGRIADPSLFLGPLMYAFGWRQDDWDLKAHGQVVGHLLECGTHGTGGNFPDPPYRVVPGMARIGLPMAEVRSDGEAVITKLPDSGGAVDVLNCKAQLVYEIHDPANYLTPDLTVDVRNVQLEQVGPDRVRVTGARGKPWPERLKVLVGVLEGYIGEGEITFAGPGAYDRARLGAEVVQERMAIDKPEIEELRVDYIGVNSVHGSATPPPAAEPYEVRLRIAGRARDKAAAEWLGREVEFLYFGPAAGAGARKSVRQVLGMYSVFLPRDQVCLEVNVREV
jgi:hypothetical protein